MKYSCNSVLTYLDVECNWKQNFGLCHGFPGFRKKPLVSETEHSFSFLHLPELSAKRVEQG